MTTDIPHTYGAECSIYKRPAATHFPSTQQTPSLLSCEHSPCSSPPTSRSPRCPRYIAPTILSLRSSRNSIRSCQSSISILNSDCKTKCVYNSKSALHLPPRADSRNPYDSIFLSSRQDRAMGHQSLKSYQAANSLDSSLSNYRNTRK
ncbi:hypothetical protein P692DRAFT_2034058 [Suillus brevipes Sb2]|nr:hypothetical protein P692DRAFT_2034058 [Suillus brevipes Sb2]